MATWEEIEAQALEAAKARVSSDMPYVHVEEARLYRYHADTKRWYVEVDVAHMDKDLGTAMVLCRVSPDAAGQLTARRVTVVEREPEAESEEQPG